MSETTAPFKSARMNRMNEAAAKLDTPLATFVFRVASTLGAGLFVVGCYAGQQWFRGVVGEIVAKNPIVYNVGTRIDDNTRRTEELKKAGDETLRRVETNERAIALISTTQTKMQDFLRSSLATQQEISTKLSTLTQKVDDGQKRAEDTEKRMDTRLNDLSHTR